MGSTSPYKLLDEESIEAGGRFVEFTVDVDHAAIERCYRVHGSFDMRERDFDLIEVTHFWGNDMVEAPFHDRATEREIERFVRSNLALIERIYQADERERDASIAG